MRAVVLLLVRHLIPALVLAQALTFGWKDLVSAARRAPLGRALVLGLLEIPIFAALVVALMPVPAAAAAVVLIMSACPGVPMQTMSVGKESGRVAEATATSIVLTIAGAIVLPLWMTIFDRIFHLGLDWRPGMLLEVLLPQIFVPLALGLGIRALWPRAAGVLRTISLWIFYVGLAAAVLALVILFARSLHVLDVWFVLAMLIITVGSALLGRVAAGSDPGRRAVLSAAAVLGNPALALAVIATTGQRAALLPALAVYLMLRTITFAGYRVFVSIGARRSGSTAVQ